MSRIDITEELNVDWGCITRGGEAQWTVTITDDDSWDSGASSWTWNMLIARRKDSTSLSKNIEATSTSLTTTTYTNDTMTLVFDATNDDTFDLRSDRYIVDVESVNGTTENYYNCVHGVLVVREPTGNG